MHLALVVDEQRLAQEQSVLNRLCIALMDEGAQLTRVVPEGLAPDEPLDVEEARIALAQRVEVPMDVLPWLRKSRTARLAERLERSVPDVIIAMGEDAWAVGGALSQVLERPLVLEVWSTAEIAHAPRGRHAGHIACYLAPTEPLGRAMRRRVDPDLVSVVPLGVAIPRHAHRVLESSNNAVALAIVGTCRDMTAYRSLLTGLSRIAHDFPQIQAFIELNGRCEHEIWRHADRLDLLDRVSAFTSASRHRPLLTQCDVLIAPESYGEVRGLIYEALAAGIPVVAGPDPIMDVLVDEETALLVGPGGPDEWSTKLRRLLSDPEFARGLGSTARQRVTDHHNSAGQAAGLISLAERILSGGALRFGVEAESGDRDGKDLS